MSVTCNLLQHNWMPAQGRGYRCERCGAEWAAGSAPLAVAESGRRPIKERIRKCTQRNPALAWICAIPLLAAVIIAATFWAWRGAYNDPANPDARRAGHLQADAYYACEEFVRRALKAPSTAQFAGQRASAIIASDGGYLIYLSVDAQNAYGARLRSRFLCSVRRQGDAGWRLRALGQE